MQVKCGVFTVLRVMRVSTVLTASIVPHFQQRAGPEGVLARLRSGGSAMCTSVGSDFSAAIGKACRCAAAWTLLSHALDHLERQTSWERRRGDEGGEGEKEHAKAMPRKPPDAKGTVGQAQCNAVRTPGKKKTQLHFPCTGRIRDNTGKGNKARNCVRRTGFGEGEEREERGRDERRQKDMALGRKEQTCM